MITYSSLGSGGNLGYAIGIAWSFVRNSSHAPDVFLFDADADRGLEVRIVEGLVTSAADEILVMI